LKEEKNFTYEIVDSDYCCEFSETQLQYYTGLIIESQNPEKRPIAVVLAGHNGSGKSTMWYEQLSNQLKIPLMNADRLMLSLFPEASGKKPLPEWAEEIRDKNTEWMRVAQLATQAYVTMVIERKLPFATETVFSHWKDLGNGKFESKIDLITNLQKQGYFVLLYFVGLRDSQMSVIRVESRVANKGHDVPVDKLEARFPRTQKAINHAITVADAAILVDNSRSKELAFTLCRVQTKNNVLFDLRGSAGNERKIPPEINAWMEKVCPFGEP